MATKYGDLGSPDMRIYSAYLRARALSEALLIAHVHSRAETDCVGHYLQDAHRLVDVLSGELDRLPGRAPHNPIITLITPQEAQP